MIRARQVAALLGELGATRTRATQAEAEKARAVAAAAAAAAPQPAALDDSKRLLGQLAALHDEVVHHFFLFAALLYLPSSFLFCPSFESLLLNRIPSRCRCRDCAAATRKWKLKRRLCEMKLLNTGFFAH